MSWEGGRNRSKTYLEAKLEGKSMAREGDGSSLVTNFCISFALLFRMDARSFEKEPLRRVRPTHFIQVEHFVFFLSRTEEIVKGAEEKG
jgi:hypothetical protein